MKAHVRASALSIKQRYPKRAKGTPASKKKRHAKNVQRRMTVESNKMIREHGKKEVAFSKRRPEHVRKPAESSKKRQVCTWDEGSSI